MILNLEESQILVRTEALCESPREKYRQEITKQATTQKRGY